MLGDAQVAFLSCRMKGDSPTLCFPNGSWKWLSKERSVACFQGEICGAVFRRRAEPEQVGHALHVA